MSSGPVRRISRQDIQLVQNLIERCLQLYMNQKEVVETLLNRAKIEPVFTELVWQRLEEENQEFFKAYYLRLMVKKQIIEFNDLLMKQIRLTNQLHSNGTTLMVPMPSSNGPHIPPCYVAGRTAAALRPENMQRPVGSSLPNVRDNGVSSHNTSMLAAVEMSAHTNGIRGPANFISAQSPYTGMIQGINGSLIKSEPIYYSANSSFVFGDASVTPSINVESNARPLNDSLLDTDTSAFGYLGQIPRNQSLSNTSAGLTQSFGTMESHTRSTFPATDTGNFSDSHESIEQDNSPNPVSESLSFEGFSSEQ